MNEYTLSPLIPVVCAMAIITTYLALRMRAERKSRERVEHIMRKNIAIFDLERKYQNIIALVDVDTLELYALEELHDIAAFIWSLKQGIGDESEAGCSMTIAACEGTIRTLQRIFENAPSGELSTTCIGPNGELCEK
jgi:hypothetical protein